MKTILVTGPIGAGKSEVCRILGRMGYPVYDSDSRTKALYESVPGLKERIESVLGIPFSELGRIFKSNSLRERLEAVVYPLVLGDFERWRSLQDSPLVFMESALAGQKSIFDGEFDEKWMVDAPFYKRRRRNPKAEQRDALQHFEKDKFDRVIVNDGTLEELEQKIKILLDFYGLKENQASM